MAGPILRFRELGPQLAFKRAWDRGMLIRGLDRIVWGLVQKNLIANNLESWVREGFMPQAASVNSTVDNWFLALAFGLQIYFDFASYSNLAIGAAQLLGITLPENFRFPYHAANPAEFWSRWHMTLSRWIRDYLFFPLSVRYRDGMKYYASLIAVMALVGLWHGAGWGFVAWGVMHALYLIAFRVWQKATGREEGKAIGGLAATLFWRAFVLAGAMAAWVPFRAATLGQAGRMFRSMFFGFRFGVSYSINFYLATTLVAMICVVEPYLCGWLTKLDKSWTEGRWMPLVNPLLVRPVLYALGLFLFLVLDDRDTGFIYFQF
jgi:alginate O-acetyltransferase complex protein AlgI